MLENNTVILGSGVASCACAISLAQRGVKATLLKHIGLSNRHLSVGEHLPPEGKPLLRILGLESILTAPEHRESSGSLSYWNSREATIKNYLFNPLGSGLNLNRGGFNEALFAAACEAGVTVIDYERIEKISQSPSVIDFEFQKDGAIEDIQCTFLVDGTGRASIAARQFGSKPIRHDKLIGLYGCLENNNYPDNRLGIEALEDGWWYSAPLSDDKLIAVYMTDSDMIPKGAAARQDYWKDRLRQSRLTQERIGAIATPAIFQIFDAATQTVSIPCGENWLSLGDALMAFDPISSAGMTKALSGGIKAAEMISQHYQGHLFDAQSYQEDSQRRFQTYLASSKTAYSAVTRFRHSAFWQRRH